MIDKLQPKQITGGIDPNNEPKAFNVDSKGNLHTVITDEAGNSQFIGAFSETLVGTKKSDISVQFQYNLLNTEFDLNPNTTVTTGDGVNTSASSYAQVSSAVTGIAVIESRDSIAYDPGHTGFGDFTGLFQGTGNGWAGPHDDDDGFPLKLANNNASFGYLKSGVETGSSGGAGFDDQSIWNGTLPVSDVDFTKVNIFRVTFGYLGVANPTLWIKKDKWYTLHTVLTEGRLEGTHLDNPVFPIRIKAENGMIVRSGSWNGGNIGNGKNTGTRGFGFPNTLLVDGIVLSEQGSMELTSTNVGTIVLFRNKAEYGGKTNKVKTKLLSYEFHIDIPGGNVVGEVVFQLVRVSALSGAGSYTDINNLSSVMEYDHTPGTGASVNITAGKPLITKTLQYVGSNKGGVSSSSAINAESLGAYAYNGDIIGVIAKDLGGNTVTVRVDLNWQEIF